MATERLACGNVDSCEPGVEHDYPTGRVRFLRAHDYRILGTDKFVWIGGGVTGEVEVVFEESHEVAVNVHNVLVVVDIAAVRPAS